MKQLVQLVCCPEHVTERGSLLFLPPKETDRECPFVGLEKEKDTAAAVVWTLLPLQ